MSTFSFVFLLVAFLSVAACDQDVKNLGGPVAVVDGPVPTHGFLGIVFDPNEQDKLLVAEIVPGTPLAASTLRVGDAVLAIDSTPVDDFDALIALLKDKVPQQVVEVRYLHDGEEQIARVALLSFSEFVVAQERARVEPDE